MREYDSDIDFICLEAETLAKKRFSLKVFLIAHSHCLATIASFCLATIAFINPKLIN